MSDKSDHLTDLLPQSTTVSAPYKVVSNHPIDLSVYIPTILSTSKQAHFAPLLVRYHGGNWITGSRNSHEWLARWILQFALQHNAVVVMPDYRLLPESSGSDILSDLADFIRWLPQNLSRLTEPHGATVDLGRTLLTGESAGGWCAVETGLLCGTGLHGFPGPETRVKIQAVISQFGGLNPQMSSFKPREIPGAPIMTLDYLDQHFAAIEAGDRPPIVTGALFPARRDLIAAIVQQGKMESFFGGNNELNPTILLWQASACPPTWAFHGADDTISRPVILPTWMKEAREVFGGDVKVKETMIPGEHGVGTEMSRDEAWVKDGLDWIEGFWPLVPGKKKRWTQRIKGVLKNDYFKNVITDFPTSS